MLNIILLENVCKCSIIVIAIVIIMTKDFEFVQFLQLKMSLGDFLGQIYL